MQGLPISPAPHDTAGADDRFSAAPTALGFSSGSISQPFRAGLTFGGRPAGPCIYSDLCCVISPSTCRRQVSCSAAPGKGVPFYGEGALVSGVAKNAGAIAFVATSSNERGNAV